MVMQQAPRGSNSGSNVLERPPPAVAAPVASAAAKTATTTNPTPTPTPIEHTHNGREEKNTNDEEDRRIARFLAWLREHGARFDKVEWPSYKTVSGIRGAVALQDIEANEDMVSIPEKLMLTPVKALDDPEISHVFEDPALVHIFGNDDDMLLLVFLMHERSKWEASFFYPYLSILPKRYDTLLEWDDEHLALLQDEMLVSQVHLRRSQLEADYYRLVEDGLKARFPDIFDVCALNNGGNGEDDDPYSFDNFAYAWYTIQSRAFGRRLPYSSLVPLSDNFNHGNVAVKYRLDKGSDSVCEDDRAFHLFPSGDNRYKKGQEVFTSYGRRTNAELLLSYGFALLDNEHEVVEVELPGIPKPPSWFHASLVKLGGRVGEVFKATHTLAAGATGVNEYLLAYCRALVACRRHHHGNDDNNAKNAIDFLEPLPSPADEETALREMQTLLEQTLASHPTTIKQDEEELRRQNEGEGEEIMEETENASWKGGALVYRMTRKRVLAHHLALVKEKRGGGGGGGGGGRGEGK